ncbi:MAG TPA: PilN domain-containing protein [Stenotrophobium sp.]|jgi:type IV pilus assembly protein PilN|nr:PilN domain-containing protein [Stenotrophobium sp.]
MATHINLLDWRQARRDRHKKQFFTMLGLAAVGSIALVLLGLLTATAAIEHQNARNDYLKQQIAETDKKIKEIHDLENTKASLLARMQVIEQLQANRSATVHFFDEIVNTVPDGVTLTGIKQSGDSVTIEGVADSNGRVSTYMKNLEASQWFADPKLIVIKTSEKDKQRKSEFTLQVKNLTKATDKKKAAGEEDEE